MGEFTMNWTDVQSAWMEFADQILARWPELHGEKLVEIAGDRTAFAGYLSNSHDLTLSEASEVIETWILGLQSQVVEKAYTAA